jgi:hypothetical protein
VLRWPRSHRIAVQRLEPYSDVGRDRQRGSIQLIDKKAVAARELLGDAAHFVCEVDRLLVDEKFLRRRPLR